jgi:hypothetical protein
MTPTQFWQNFQLGFEQEIACNFIYDGLRNLHDMETLDQETEIFPVLYDLSIGIERLLKVAVVLVKYNEETDVESLERSIITHNHIKLLKLIDGETNIGLGAAHIALLELLSKFYKTHRYDRFILGSVYDLSKEKKALHDFLHVYLEIDTTKDISGVMNSLRIRKFIGRAVKKISKQIHSIIEREAAAKSLYTYEISGSSSKAAKILWGEDDILFENEEIAVIEILLFLMKTQESPLVDILKSIEPLKLDPALSSEYLQFLLKKRASDASSILDEVEARYEDLEQPGEREKMISALKEPGMYFDSTVEDE